MLLDKTSFDAIVTDSKGQKLDVDCCVSEPVVSGAAASITIQVPLTANRHAELVNPCILQGKVGRFDVEIDELWYHRLPFGGTRRKLARDVLDLSHVGRLTVRSSHLENEETFVLFHLSAVEYLRHHAQAAMTPYSSTPSMSVELFKIHAAGLGDIAFLKQWSIHYRQEGNVSAKICAGFSAKVVCQEQDLHDVDGMVKRFKEVLIVLSILFRQAVTLHGWQTFGRTTIESTWLEPLHPNLAPYMAPEPNNDLTFLDEFQACAQSLVDKYLVASDVVKKVVQLLSVAVAPHLKRTDAGNFTAMFSALEEAISLEKLTVEERGKLRESDGELTKQLTQLRLSIDSEKPPHFERLSERIEGIIKAVGSGGPSFSVRFQKFVSAYPPLNLYMSDLWPIMGTSKIPGLKQIRDSLAHGLQHKYSLQALGVSLWHFSILIERLVFILIGATVPKGIHINSALLSREEWYGRHYWTALQKDTKKT
jgi:hypothetical protein